MKTSCSFALVACLLIVPAVVFAGTRVTAASPIAYYPLLSDSLDALGLNAPMFKEDAPYEEGGVYCNGIYGSYQGGFKLETPNIEALNFDSFAASIEFKMSQYTDFNAPVLVGGQYYRWIGALIGSDGRLIFLSNNSNYSVSSTVATLDTWHQVVLCYTAGIGTLYLDGAFVSSAEFGLINGGDKDFGPRHPGSGTGFLGIVRHLVVYDGPIDPTPVRPASWGLVKLLGR